MLGIKDCWNPTMEELEIVFEMGFVVVLSGGAVVEYEWEERAE